MRKKIEDLKPVFRIRITRIRLFLGFPDLDLLDRGTVPEPASGSRSGSFHHQAKIVRKTFGICKICNELNGTPGRLAD
jgi:hypothetical protein